MSVEEFTGVNLVGLPVLNEDRVTTIGAVTDVCADQDGSVTGLKVRTGWIAGDRFLESHQCHIENGTVMTPLDRSNLPAAPAGGAHDLMGIEVRSHDGEVLGKISKVMVDPGSLKLVGFELSSGMMKDWIQGRSHVVFGQDENLGDHRGDYIVLSEEARTVTAQTEDSGPAVEGLEPIDWERVRRTPEDQLRAEMACVVWQRRGAPDDGQGQEQYIAAVSTLAQALKEAAMKNDTGKFNDLALLTGDQVEALRIYRIGAEPLDRFGPATEEIPCEDTAREEAA